MVAIIYEDSVLEKKLAYTSQLYAFASFLLEYNGNCVILLWGQLALNMGVDSTILSSVNFIAIIFAVLTLVWYSNYAPYPNVTAAVIYTVSACTTQIWNTGNPAHQLRTWLSLSLILLPVFGAFSYTTIYLSTTMLRKMNRANQDIASKWIGFTNYHLIAANLISAVVRVFLFVLGELAPKQPPPDFTTQ